MKTEKRIVTCLLGLILLSASIFAFEPVATCDLLVSYLENDNDLKKNAINAQKAQLSLDSTKISNGFDVTLSTGTITIRTVNNDTAVSIKPSVQASVPQASGLGISASTSIGIANSETKLEDTKLNASVDIISSNGLTRKIALLKAERSLTEAKRKLQNQAINSEKAFYTELKALLNSTNSIINLQKTLYTNKIDFEKTKAQGYSSGSSTYRLANMKVLSTQHEIENSTRSLIHSYVIFYKKCGYDITIEENIDFYQLIPQDITAIEPLNIKDFKAEQYNEIESAMWTNQINSMQRKAKSGFSLKANGGVTLNNTTTDSTTIDAGLSSGYKGVSLSAGVSMPVENMSSPAMTFSATVTPNSFRQSSISEQTDALEEKEEQIAIETAHSNFATKIIDYEQTLIDLEWSEKADTESYEMYKELEKDLSKWYKDGFITESEYYSARVNVQYYTVKKIINTIDYIIYNDNIITMFVDVVQEN